MVFETGKPLNEANGEVSEAIDFCRYYADEMERLDAGVAYDFPGETNRYHYQPLGIVVVISPWNFPLAIPTGMTVAALVAGNCVLLKPAETSSVIIAKLTEILVEAGIPSGVFQYVPGKGSTVGAHLVKHPQTNMITFTGSQEVGCRIYADAAILQPGQKHLKRVVAEMGGKNAIIVDESADLDQAGAGRGAVCLWLQRSEMFCLFASDCAGADLRPVFAAVSGGNPIAQPWQSRTSQYSRGSRH
jgi:RHH-type proline utilization regulon transcriptional repressor/proline dehydrogenase/delta 1-pyrroline-5-carboxylate dehydrogenase